MNKTSLELKKVYLRMKKLNKPSKEIADVYLFPIQLTQITFY